MYNTEQLETEQRRIAALVNTNTPAPTTIKYLAGFDIIYTGHQALCAAVVLDAKTLTVVERKHTITKAPMPYISGFRAFRDGPLIIQTYYDLEHEPDILFINGHGTSHARQCGVATYVGVELEKPTVGVSKTLPETNNDISNYGEITGKILQTKQHANAILVSPGHLLTLTNALELVTNTTRPPHKLPSPLHYAHKHARTIMKNGNEPELETEDDTLTEHCPLSSIIV